MASSNNSTGSAANTASTSKTAPATKRVRSPRSPKSSEQVAKSIRTQVSKHLVDIGVDHERAPEIMSSLRNLTSAIHPQGGTTAAVNTATNEGAR